MFPVAVLLLAILRIGFCARTPEAELADDFLAACCSFLLPGTKKEPKLHQETLEHWPFAECGSISVMLFLRQYCPAVKAAHDTGNSG